MVVCGVGMLAHLDYCKRNSITLDELQTKYGTIQETKCLMVEFKTDRYRYVQAMSKNGKYQILSKRKVKE
jgi:hypothetical protein